MEMKKKQYIGLVLKAKGILSLAVEIFPLFKTIQVQSWRLML